MAPNEQRLAAADEWKYAEKSMDWHGWGSPVGLGFVLVALGICAVLVRVAVLGLAG